MPDQLDTVLRLCESDEDAEALAYGAVSDPLKYWCPHGGQERMIKSVAEAIERSKISVILATSANGWGKTTTTVNLLLNFVYGAQNGWFDYECFKTFPFPKLCWWVTTSTALKNVTIPMIEALAKAGTYKCYNQGKPTVSMIKFDNGWQINFFTTDQGIEQFESATVGLIVCDEPVDEPIYKALKSRKRAGNVMIMPMTPLDCDPYLIDEIVANAGNGVYYHIEGSVYEASKANDFGEHCGVRGHLDAEVIDKMVADYDMEEREARVYGRFMYFSERIWANFKESLTIVNPEQFPINFEKDRIIQVADPHDGRESACVYFALKDNGRVIAFAETPKDISKPFWDQKRQVNIKDEVRVWAELEYNYGFTPGKRVMDKRFAWQKRGGSNLATLFADAGKDCGIKFIVSPSYKNESDIGEIAYGHRIVRTYFEDMGDGFSKLVVWDCCYHLINGIKHYVRKRPKTASELNKASDENKIIEKYKDFNDVLRYGLVELADYTKTIEGRKKRKKIVIQYHSDPIRAILG